MKEIDFSFALRQATDLPEKKELSTRQDIPKFSEHTNFNVKEKDGTLNDYRFELWKKVRDFLKDVYRDEDPYWLTLCGVPGCGKSHLLDESVEYVRKFCSEYQQYIPAINDTITQSHKIQSIKGTRIVGDRINFPDFYHSICSCHFLGFDELGIDSESGYFKETVYDVLNERLDQWTIITTNKTLKEISEQFDARIADRLQRGGNQFYQTQSPAYIK